MDSHNYTPVLAPGGKDKEPSVKCKIQEMQQKNGAVKYSTQSAANYQNIMNQASKK